MSRTNKHKKLGFTNTMFLSIGIITLLVAIFACILMWKTNDTTGLAYLIPSVFGEFATITGFAIKKSEKENTVGGIVYDAAMNNNPQLDDEPKG